MGPGLFFLRPRALDLQMSGTANIPRPYNEPVLGYAPGSDERAALKSTLTAVGSERPEIPAVVGGRDIRSGTTQNVVSPHCHTRVLATLHQADGATIEAAVRSAVEAQRDWAHWRFEDRASVFLKAADLLATTWRQRLNAATMLGQSKTAFQAEIDSACELIDFLRFNVHYAERIHQRAARLRARRVEPHGPSPARGVRLRHHAVQLHRHRRQPADRAGADGERRGVEAGRTPRRSATGTSTSCSSRRDCRPGSSTSSRATRSR